MIYHPTIIILTSIIALLLSIRQKRIFSAVTLLIPVLAAISLYYLPDLISIRLYNITIIAEGSDYNKLIGYAFIIVLFAANLYALGQNKFQEIIYGNAYAAFAFFCLLAGDFISMFVGLELMMVTSAAIIFIGGMRASLRSAKKYFITHLMSSNLIIIGITHLIAKNGSTALIPANELMNNPEYSPVILTIMLIGMLVNVATFPFSGWMVNYYPKASPSGFLYLISFTTKVSVMVLLKLFAGYEPLKYVAIIMISYAAIKTIFEDNLFSLLCYLSILSMGIMMLGISIGTHEAISATVCYLFIHILYKSLLSISFASLIDSTGIECCTEIKRINSKFIIAGTLIGIIMMVNLPITSSFYIKSAISHLFAGDPIYFIIMLVTFIMLFALPWRRYLKSEETASAKLNLHSKASILFMSIVLIIVAIAGSQFPVISALSTFQEIKIIGIDTTKQFAIIAIAIAISACFTFRRKNTAPINLTEWIADIFFYLYSSWLKKGSTIEHEKEPWAIENLERQATSKLASLHNQQTAIFIVFTIFLVMLVVLTVSV